MQEQGTAQNARERVWTKTVENLKVLIVTRYNKNENSNSNNSSSNCKRDRLAFLGALGAVDVPGT